MSETKTKRVNKSREVIVDDLQKKREEDFKTELRALEDKYEFRLEPILHFSNRGVVPVITVVDAPKVEKSMV